MRDLIIGADPEALRAAQPAVHDLADTVRRIAAGLGSALAAEGRCWGSDEWGALFAGSYLPASSAARSLLDGAAREIDDVAVALGVIADLFAAAERAAGRDLA